MLLICRNLVCNLVTFWEQLLVSVTSKQISVTCLTLEILKLSLLICVLYVYQQETIEKNTFYKVYTMGREHNIMRAFKGFPLYLFCEKQKRATGDYKNGIVMFSNLSLQMQRWIGTVQCCKCERINKWCFC